jgi:hypothetical protein
VKRATRPILGFPFFDAAQCPFAGLALRHTLRKGQMEEGGRTGPHPCQTVLCSRHLISRSAKLSMVSLKNCDISCAGRALVLCIARSLP